MSTSAFESMGLKPRMGLTTDEVERAYLSRVSALHPDVARGDPDAAGKIAELNRARAELLDAESRANALLIACGGASAQEDRTLPDGFLMEIMEIRERAETAQATGDQRLREELMDWASDRRARHVEQISAWLDDAEPSAESLRLSRMELNAWRYIERMIEQIDEKRVP